MPRGIDDLSKTMEMLERTMEFYRSPETVFGIATALSTYAENPVSQDVSERLNSPAVEFATQIARTLENPMSVVGAAAEAQDLMEQNPGIAQAVSSYADYTSHLDIAEGLSRAAEIERLGLNDAIDWLPRSGLEDAIERNQIFENCISEALDAARPVFADIDRYHTAIDSMSSIVMGLSGILQSTFPAPSVISNVCKAIPATLSMWESYRQIDTDLLCGVAERVLARAEDWTVDSVAEAITQEYDTEVSMHWHTDAKDEVDETGKLVSKDPKRIDPEKVRDWILAIIAVIELCCNIFGASGGINISIDNSFNSVKQTNNYYITEQRANADFLNGCCYRIVNRETKARLKRDCHSAVVGTLKEGQVVILRDKNKKWIQVEWEDENGEACLGWIQNYKVTEFVPAKGRRK